MIQITPHISHKKIIKIVVAGLLLSIVSAEFYIYIHNKNIDSKVIIKEFSAILKIIDGDTLDVIGVYKTDSDNEDIPRMPFPAKIKVTDKTIITRVTVYYPPAEERKKNGGRIDWEKLRKEEAQVSFDQLRADAEGNDVAIIVETGSSIYKKTYFTATAVKYQVDQY